MQSFILRYFCNCIESTFRSSSNAVGKLCFGKQLLLTAVIIVKIPICPSYRPPQALSSESFERLPVFNKSVWRHYQTGPEADDWSNPSSDPRDASTYKTNR